MSGLTFTFTVKARIEAGTLNEDEPRKYTLQGGFLVTDEDGNETTIGDMGLPVGQGVFFESQIGDVLCFPLTMEDKPEGLKLL